MVIGAYYYGKKKDKREEKQRVKKKERLGRKWEERGESILKYFL